MSDEQSIYGGKPYANWTNRETWSLKLWLDNSQGLYEMAHERVRQALDDAVNVWKDGFDDRATRMAGEAIKDFWEEITDPDEQLMSVETILQMVRDVGSEYRVNWDEIGASYLSDIEEGY